MSPDDSTPSITHEKPITVYVRKDGDDARTLSFDRVPEISDQEALNQWCAIDGRSLVLSVSADLPSGDGGVLEGGPGGDEGRLRPLMEVLRDAQAYLAAWIETKGYAVEFD